MELENRRKDMLLWVANAVLFAAAVVSIPRVMGSGLRVLVLPALFMVGAADVLGWRERDNG